VIVQEQELWTYAGIRQTGGKKVDCWLTVEGTELWFPSKGSHAIGHQYVVTVERSENGRVTKADRDKYSNAPTEDVEGYLEGWTALHRAAQTELGRKSRRLAPLSVPHSSRTSCTSSTRAEAGPERRCWRL
jgi:hypothetical protein